MDFANFDARNIEPPKSYEPIPANWYKVVIAQAEERPTKAQTGSYIRLEIEVIEGEYAGRRIFENLNTDNENQTAKDIATRQLGSLCRAIHTPTPRALGDLCDKPLMVKVAIKPARDGYEASNRINEYAALDGQAAPAPAPKATSTPPWKR
jgi:hypothetical protein